MNSERRVTLKTLRSLFLRYVKQVVAVYHSLMNIITSRQSGWASTHHEMYRPIMTTISTRSFIELTKLQTTFPQSKRGIPTETHPLPQQGKEGYFGRGKRFHENLAKGDPENEVICER